MTRKDTIGVLAMLQTAYPGYYAKQSEQQMRESINLWADLFADDNPQIVYAAVKTIIVSGGPFPPSIGEIKAKMRDLTTEDELSETQAWALVSKALRNGIYGYKAEFEKLPPTVQAAVGRAEMLKEWAVMPEEDLSVISSNFMRGYKTVQRRERETAMIPESVKTLIAGVTQAMLPEVAK